VAGHPAAPLGAVRARGAAASAACAGEAWQGAAGKMGKLVKSWKKWLLNPRFIHICYMYQGLERCFIRGFNHQTYADIVITCYMFILVNTKPR